jgi:hypothetical protein
MLSDRAGSMRSSGAEQRFARQHAFPSSHGVLGAIDVRECPGDV